MYEKEGWTASQFKPEKIELTKATMNGNPIILEKEELLKTNGNPIERIDSCARMTILRNQGMAIYNCWVYDSTWSMVYKIADDTAFLSRLSFEERNIEIETPQITLSKNTRFKEVKSKFPNAYAHRNIGPNLYRIDGYDWVYLIDDSSLEERIYPSRIELIFKGDKLKYFEYNMEPKYTQEQLNVYHKQMEEEKNRN